MKSARIFLAAAIFALAGCVHRYAPDDALGKGDEPFVPAEFRNGTASLKQVKAYASSLLGYLGGQSSLEMMEADLNQDGTRDLLVADDSGAGSGGNVYLAFAKTPTGYRYLGDLSFGALRVLPKDASGKQKMLTMSCAGSGNCTVFLVVLDASGFHEVARAYLAAGDSGTNEDNRTADELFGTNQVSAALLAKVFGKGVE